jgi:hypothetical protein
MLLSEAAYTDCNSPSDPFRTESDSRSSASP